MAFQSGTVTSFSGANGLLTALLAFVKGTEVTGETLSGSGTSYSGTLANSPVGLGRMVVTYIIGGVTYTATDDGSGAFTGTGISSGSITYATGAYAFTFSSAPSAAPTVDYIYGAEGQDWREEVNRNTRSVYTAGDVYTEPFGSDCKEVILSNKGLNGTDNVLIGIREWRYVPGSAWGWDLNGYRYLATGDYDWNFTKTEVGFNTYDTTWGHFSQKPILPCADDTMYYWFYSNQQRIIIVTKISSNYESAYLGFGRRFATPTEYPYPLIVAGSGYGNITYSSTGTSHSFCIACQYSIATYNFITITPDNVIRQSINTTGGQAVLYPHYGFVNSGELYPDTAGRFFMSPVYAIHISAVNSTLFDLDGLYHILGVGLQSEDIVTFNSRKHRVFQNIYRNTYYEFIAVDEAIATTTTSTSSTTSTTN